MNRWTTKTIALLAAAVLAGVLWDAPSRQAAAGGGACHVAPPEREATGDLVKLTKNCFAPTVLRATAGTAVTFQNDDLGPHHISGVANEWGVDFAKNLAPGESQAFIFASPGTYAYSCYIHVGMSGVIVVGDGKSGVESVSVRVPVAGARTLGAASEPSAPANQPATVAAAGSQSDDAAGRQSLVFGALGALAGGAIVAGVFKAKGMFRA